MNPQLQEILHNITTRLTKLEQAEKQAATIEDNSQDWAKLDGAVAWHLIERHADNWADVGKMMDEYVAAKLAKPEQEPVAYLYHDTACAELANPLADSTLLVLACDRKPNGRNEIPLYTAPPRKEWVGLTDEEINNLDYSGTRIEFVRAIEAKLKEKNGGV